MKGLNVQTQTPKSYRFVYFLGNTGQPYAPPRIRTSVGLAGVTLTIIRHKLRQSLTRVTFECCISTSPQSTLNASSISLPNASPCRERPTNANGWFALPRSWELIATLCRLRFSTRHLQDATFVDICELMSRLRSGPPCVCMNHLVHVGEAAATMSHSQGLGGGTVPLHADLTAWHFGYGASCPLMLVACRELIVRSSSATMHSFIS